MLSLFASPEEVELLRLRRFYGTPTVAVAGDEQVHPPRRLANEMKSPWARRLRPEGRCARGLPRRWLRPEMLSAKTRRCGPNPRTMPQRPPGGWGRCRF